MMPAVEAFSGRMSSTKSAVTPSRKKKVFLRMPFSSRMVAMNSAAVPTRLIFTTSAGWMVFPPNSIHRLASFTFSVKSVVICMGRASMSPTAHSILK